MEEGLELRHYINVMLRRWRLLALGPIIAGLAALGLSLAQPPPPSPLYEATTLLLMEGTGGLGNAAELVKTRPVLEGVVDSLSFPLSVEQLRTKVSVEPVNGARLLKISVEDSDPARAVDLADGVAESLIAYIETLRQPLFTPSPQDPANQLPGLDSLVTAGAAPAIAEALTSLTRRPSVVAPAEALQKTAATTGTGVIPDVLLGIILGGVLSVAAVASLEYLRDPVRSPEQLESRFGLTRLGAISGNQKKRKLRRPPAAISNSSPASIEAIRPAAANIEFAALPRGIKTLAVASPNQGDGRSNLIANLGIALATAWRNVILVDTDLRCPSLHRYFDLDNSLGLSSFLSNPAVLLADALKETAYPRLKVITSGPVPPNPVELLRCPRMGQLLEDLKEAADLALLDTPPALKTADGVILAAQAEGIIILVSAANTRMGAMQSTLSSLEKAGAPILGFVWSR